MKARYDANDCRQVAQAADDNINVFLAERDARYSLSAMQPRLPCLSARRLMAPMRVQGSSKRFARGIENCNLRGVIEDAMMPAMLQYGQV